MAIRGTVVLLLITILAAAPLQGQVLPGRWEKVEALQRGTVIIIKLKTGDRLEGAFESVRPDAVALTEGSAQERTIPRSMIQRIEISVQAPDRLRNGTLIGLWVGAVAGIAGMVAFANAKTDGPVYWWDEDGPGFLISAALAGGGIGAATGAVVDASIKRPELLYQSQ
jgi:hypothetical protein